MHFAVSHNMMELTKSLLTLPGGNQMATMTNSDGLNARDMAVHAGNLELAKLLKDPKVPRQNYEYPVLKSVKKEDEDATKFQFHDYENDDPKSPVSPSEGLYDIPRKVEQCYIVPPAPRPVESALKLKYVSMNKSRSELMMTPPPQSRQELLRPLVRASSLEDLPEPHDLYYVKIDEPRSPLDIVNPFPLTLAHNSQRNLPSPQDRLKGDLVQVQNKQQFFTLSDVEAKYEEWKCNPYQDLVDEKSRADLTQQWEEIIASKKREENEKSFRQKFRKLIKTKKNKNNNEPGSKYSTLPSMPLRLKKGRTVSSSSIPHVEPNSNLTLRNKSSSECETNRNSDSESSSNLSFEK